MTTDFTLTTEQLDAAIDYVIETGALMGAVTVSCASAIASASVTVDDDGIAEFMELFHGRCVERELPPLDCLIVEDSGFREGQPPTAYFAVNNQPDPFNGAGPVERVARGRRFLETQRHRVRSWGLEQSEVLSS